MRHFFFCCTYTFLSFWIEAKRKRISVNMNERWWQVRCVKLHFKMKPQNYYCKCRSHVYSSHCKCYVSCEILQLLTIFVEMCRKYIKLSKQNPCHFHMFSWRYLSIPFDPFSHSTAALRTYLETRLKVKTRVRRRWNEFCQSNEEHQERKIKDTCQIYWNVV